MSIKAETVSMEITVMVYCPKCGTKNEEDVKFCVNCGAALYAEEKRERRRTTCFGAERRREDECFGLPHGGAIAGVIFGAFIILIGIALVLEQDIWRLIWPFMLIIIGVLIVAGVLYGLSRRRS